MRGDSGLWQNAPRFKLTMLTLHVIWNQQLLTLALPVTGKATMRQLQEGTGKMAVSTG